MLGVALAGLRAHRLRLAMTGLAIALAAGFVAGTLILTDMMRAGAYEKFAGAAREISVAVLPTEPGQEIPRDVARRVEAVPGVDAVVGDLRGPAPLVGKDGRVVGDYATLGVALHPDGPAVQYDVLEGRVPRTSREAVLGDQTVERAQYAVGDTIRVVGHDGEVRPLHLVGIVDFGLDRELSWRGGVGLLPEALSDLADVHAYQHLAVASAAGVTAAELRKSIDTKLAPAYEVLTGQQLADRRVSQFVGDVQVLTTGLLLFGLVAVGVATLVIYNTFQILVAQRMREMALLRCVGASRRQVFTAVLGESSVVGVVASVAGLALGIGLAFASYRVLASALYGTEFPVALAGLSPVAVAATLVVGVGMTVASGLLPAWRATRVAPVSALRLQAEPGARRFRAGVLRVAAVVVFGGMGSAVTVLGLAMEPGQTGMLVVAAGGTAVFVGLAAVLPLLTGPLSRVIGWLPGRLFGAPARLATDNAGRNPRRTATTTLALTVGVGLVTLLTVVMNSSRASVVSQLEEQFPVDFAIRTAAFSGESGESRDLPRELAAALRARAEIGQVTEVRETRTTLGGQEQVVRTVTQSALGTAVNPEIEAGSLEAFEAGTVMLATREARRLGVALGDQVALETRDGTVRVRVAATFSASTPMTPQVLLPEDDFDRYFGHLGDSAIYADAAAGVAVGDARRAVDQATRAYPLAQVTTAGGLSAEIRSSFNTLFGIVAALLGLSIVIAVVGIANTLSLSVLERTRESALLRALGLTRRQLRRILRAEAAVIAVMGGALGVGLGLAYGWFGSRTITAAEDVVFAAPPAQIGGYLVLAGVVGVLAAVLPARRAARTSVVAALAEE